MSLTLALRGSSLSAISISSSRPRYPSNVNGCDSQMLPCKSSAVPSHAVFRLRVSLSDSPLDQQQAAIRRCVDGIVIELDQTSFVSHSASSP